MDVVERSINLSLGMFGSIWRRLTWKYLEKIDEQKKALWWKSNEHGFLNLLP